MFDDIFGWTHAVKFRFYFSVIQGGPITLVPLADNYGNNHKKEKFSRTTDWSSIVAWGQELAGSRAPQALRPNTGATP